MAGFKGSPTTILSKQYQSPICVGPFPALHDVKLALNGEQVKAGAAIKSVCDQMGMMCVVPIEQVREVVRDTPTKNPFLLYVVPDQAIFQKQVKLIKHVIIRLGDQVAGVVLECGYTPQLTSVDKKNRYNIPARVLENKPAPTPTNCNFKFQMISYLKDNMKSDLPIVIRGIASVDDALKAAEFGASAVWLSEKPHFNRSASSPISLLHNVAQCLANLHPTC